MATSVLATPKGDYVPDGYVIVERKAPPASGQLPQQPAGGKQMEYKTNILARPRLLRGMGKGKNSLVTMRLALRGASSSASATANIFGVGLTPSAYNEWTEVKALYDEVKVLNQDLYFTVSTVGPGISVWGTVAYSPGSYALTSVADGAVQSQHLLFAVNANTNGSAVLCTSPQPSNPTGIFHRRFLVPKGSLRNVSSPATMGGSDWSATTDSADDYGSATFYVESAGSSQATTVSWLSVITVQARCRG